MKALLLVAAGGALGSIARYLVVLLFVNSRLPLGTLLVNIAGSFCIGLVASLSRGEAPSLSPNTALFLMTGVLGGFTTFSAFSLQTLHLIQQNNWPQAILNILGSVLLCLLAAWAGMAIGGLRS